MPGFSRAVSFIKLSRQGISLFRVPKSSSLQLAASALSSAWYSGCLQYVYTQNCATWQQVSLNIGLPGLSYDRNLECARKQKTKHGFGDCRGIFESRHLDHPLCDVALYLSGLPILLSTCSLLVLGAFAMENRAHKAQQTIEDSLSCLTKTHYQGAHNPTKKNVNFPGNMSCYLKQDYLR